MPEMLSFEDALDRASGESKQHVLLGNGFSRACRDDIFAYGNLFNRADFKNLSSTARRAFDALRTTDFEMVMRALRNAAAVVELYSDDPSIAARLAADADGLRDVLARTIADSHPGRPNEISRAQYSCCRSFLAHFDRIYTLNYDLLLYWAMMQSELGPALRCDDGFRQPDDGPEDYVTWDVENTATQNIYYLHGALHVFDAGSQLQKFTWVNTQIALIDQIRTALRSNRYPLFVAEGSSDEKLARIQHSGFLNRAFRSFASLSGALFVYGHSMAENDEHVLHLIDRGKIKLLMVGLYGSPRSASNQSIITRAGLMADRRPGRRPLEVRFFDAESAQVWGCGRLFQGA